ncbi:jg6399 [Pararge aegeria aegeria]|uniref:Jg6399 protein n=1 Tax=Pararge aegeria aegeria TaxID=348720 RepID=A0A8S4RT07_9NEOP|nr:jg6399 [Pararge aegeria aegeria]
MGPKEAFHPPFAGFLNVKAPGGQGSRVTNLTIHAVSRIIAFCKRPLIQQPSEIFLRYLAEVLTVSQAAPAPGPPKKCDERSFFDLRTSRRTYNFCASDANAAQEWTEKLQACLQ